MHCGEHGVDRAECRRGGWAGDYEGPGEKLLVLDGSSPQRTIHGVPALDTPCHGECPSKEVRHRCRRPQNTACLCPAALRSQGCSSSSESEIDARVTMIHSARRSLTQSDAYLPGMAHKGVRPAGDQRVLVHDTDFECEQASKRLVAPCSQCAPCECTQGAGDQHR